MEVVPAGQYTARSAQQHKCKTKREQKHTHTHTRAPTPGDGVSRGRARSEPQVTRTGHYEYACITNLHK